MTVIDERQRQKLANPKGLIFIPPLAADVHRSGAAGGTNAVRRLRPSLGVQERRGPGAGEPRKPASTGARRKQASQKRLMGARVTRKGHHQEVSQTWRLRRSDPRGKRKGSRRSRGFKNTGDDGVLVSAAGIRRYRFGSAGLIKQCATCRMQGLQLLLPELKTCSSKFRNSHGPATRRIKPLMIGTPIQDVFGCQTKAGGLFRVLRDRTHGP